MRGERRDVRWPDFRLAVCLAECAPLAVSSMAQGDIGDLLKLTGGLRFEEREIERRNIRWLVMVGGAALWGRRRGI